MPFHLLSPRGRPAENLSYSPQFYTQNMHMVSSTHGPLEYTIECELKVLTIGAQKAANEVQSCAGKPDRGMS